jgi:hypothetical protein
LREFLDDLEQLRNDPFRLDREPQHLADLPKADTDGDAVEEADKDGPGEKIRHGAKPEKACDDAEQAG